MRMGVSVYIKTLLKTKILKYSGFWLQIQHKKLKSMILCVVYKAPNCLVNCFVNDFMDTYTCALMFGKEIFVVDNLNCDMLRKCPEADAIIYAAH